MRYRTEIIGLFLFGILFIGCSSLPNNITNEEYDKVRDFVSIEVSGMRYLKLYDAMERQRQINPNSDDSRRYNKYMIEISSNMNILVSRYQKTDQITSFYSWAINDYRNNGFYGRSSR